MRNDKKDVVTVTKQNTTSRLFETGTVRDHHSNVVRNGITDINFCHHRLLQTSMRVVQRISISAQNVLTTSEIMNSSMPCYFERAI